MLKTVRISHPTIFYFNLCGLVVRVLDFLARVPRLKPLGGSKVDTAFHYETNQMSTSIKQ